ncbi:MAG: hypothetical protein GWP59_03825 [Chlamydiales bacterium]|nr:hypothetical protein [Chlamydiales bacterium]NCF70814.1 hypothetical protein [Chlamydiales bacterium]
MSDSSLSYVVAAGSPSSITTASTSIASSGEIASAAKKAKPKGVLLGHFIECMRDVEAQMRKYEIELLDKVAFLRDQGFSGLEVFEETLRVDQHEYKRVLDDITEQFKSYAALKKLFENSLGEVQKRGSTPSIAAKSREKAILGLGVSLLQQLAEYSIEINSKHIKQVSKLNSKLLGKECEKSYLKVREGFKRAFTTHSSIQRIKDSLIEKYESAGAPRSLIEKTIRDLNSKIIRVINVKFSRKLLEKAKFEYTKKMYKQSPSVIFTYDTFNANKAGFESFLREELKYGIGNEIEAHLREAIESAETYCEHKEKSYEAQLELLRRGESKIPVLRGSDVSDKNRRRSTLFRAAGKRVMSK